MAVLGIDTSNYTTSAAWFDGKTGKNCSKLLPVKEGQLGLRQSDAVFAHVKQLPDMIEALASEVPLAEVSAIGVSARPRSVEGSYMPCFLAGVGLARSLAAVLRIPLVFFSHQQGHIAASLWSSGHMELFARPHLAWHLSGGTTELLLVRPEGAVADACRIGGTTDISAGQLIDRTGVRLGLPFPAGKALDQLSRSSSCSREFPVKVKDLSFSFSGMENQVLRMLDGGAPREDVAKFCLLCVCRAVETATWQAMERYPDCPVVFSGGVASNALLRQRFSGPSFLFSPPEYATDNAMGTAVLTWLQEGNR